MDKKENYSHTHTVGKTQGTEMHGEYRLEMKSSAFTK